MCNAPNINHLWARLIIEELVRNNVTMFCLTPGSRCTPLTAAVASHPGAKKMTHYDERGAAYFALGYGRATGRPAVLICTSGTAVANYWPAVVEASNAGLPVLLLTADRPPELLDTGANQAIDQIKIFGDYTRWQVGLPCPCLEIHPETVLTTVDQAVHRSEHSPAGPVHINCMFREPLAPTKKQESFGAYLVGLGAWKASKAPYTRYARGTSSMSAGEAQAVMASVSETKRGLIVAGQLRRAEESRAVLDLARSLNWPLYPDVTSGLRFVSSDAPVIHYFDQLLLSNRMREHVSCDTILHVGGRVTSKRFLEWLTSGPPQSYVMAASHPCRHDPVHRVTLRVEADIVSFCETIAGIQSDLDAQYVERLVALSRRVDDAIEAFLKNQGGLSEPGVARIVSKRIPDGHTLFLGNSMPVRDMDMFAAACFDAPSCVAANRGASGIDGNVSTAAGLAEGLGQPVTAILGDLAALHDLNALALLGKASNPITLIVVNNNGGGVFSFLRLGELKELFEPYFGTPHGLRFDKAAEMFQVPYACPDSPDAFAAAYQSAVCSGASSLIEITTDREENYRLHKSLQSGIVAALDG